jgi:hypothetical protein
MNPKITNINLKNFNILFIDDEIKLNMKKLFSKINLYFLFLQKNILWEEPLNLEKQENLRDGAKWPKPLQE